MVWVFLNFGLLIASIAALIYIASKLIDHSVKLAALFRVSPMVIGLTLLAYGTSLPELAVSTTASFQSHAMLSVSNITGSNIYNIAVIMGIVALIVPFGFRERLGRNGLFMALSTAILILLSLAGGAGMIAGIGMMALLVLYTYYVIRTGGKETGTPKANARGSARREFLLCCLLIAALLIAGNFVVHFSVAVATMAGVSEWLIGSTIVAAGTSMPETVVSIVSARKKQMCMSLGNIVGSNYFNILWVIGLSAIIRPLSFSITDIWMDMLFLSIVTGIFCIAIFRRRFSRPEGIIYFAIYGLYVLYLLGLLKP